MKILIVYDSFFGNTGVIAQTISKSFSINDEVELCHVNNVSIEILNDFDVVIVGSPTQGFRPTKKISEFLKKIPSNELKGKLVAAFDTRFLLSSIKSSALRFIVKTGGYAGKPILERLIKKGGQPILSPEGFFVTGEKDSLCDGEIERAAEWAKKISRQSHQLVFDNKKKTIDEFQKTDQMNRNSKNKYLKNTIMLIILTCFMGVLNAQDYRQTVKGKIIDKESHTPIEFATVSLTNTTFISGTITNKNGDFKIENVPVGRVTLHISFVGYETITISNLEVTTGKELIVNIEMAESTVEIDEVQVKAFHNKEKPLNSFAPISARTFSVEESQRYAGSSNDVSRMAMNFAGVKMSAETTNEIVIRGNSSNGVLFRLDGVDIPNPSHFGDGSNTGGPIGMLNNNVLSNSDFLTGAFPAEYANAISGVFDLRMRNGNSEKHEFLGQAGLMGFELGVEGPIIRNSNSSYLVNYRYSTMGILNLIGLNVMGTAVSDYQDLTFKFNFPSSKIGNISIFGLGGKSYIKMFDSERDTTIERDQLIYESDYEIDLYNDNYSGAIGVSHSYIIGNSAYTKLILSATTIMNYNSWDSLSTKNRMSVLQYYSDFKRTKYAAKFYINKKFNSKNTIRTGVTVEFQEFDLLDSIYIGGLEIYRILRDFNGNDIFAQVYAQYQHRFNDRLHVNLGINSLHQASNRNYVIEPRVGLKWEFLPSNIISIGYGLHSISTPIEILNQKVMLPDGTYIEPNKDLDFTKSHHFVLGYDKIFSGKIRFKSEIYYQYIINAVVEKSPSSYSLLNHGSYTIIDVESLENRGKGYNYGIEFTAEKFMDHGMYFLSTLSLFESKYRGSDGVLRNTAFNSNYVFNLLGGKEFK
ncbi:MAG: carboxypeptidase-like regulatory domain-containing protein, partial [Bacteroidales bacterium]|nr:carboxypeptidase-like regulatory domain-containing protein [Bacteroidales bacterium]